MSKPLDPNFKLTEALPSDMDEVWTLCEEAFADDAIWQAVFKDCPKDQIHPWVMSIFPHRWSLPDITIYKVTELATGRLIGWTALQFPWADRPLKEEQLAIATSQELPPGIEGMNMEALVTFIESLSFAMWHGYDPVKDYHRKGTMIHPDFQKRGFGTALTHHCNAVSDKTGGKTWVPARPSSIKMFKQCGFENVATHDAHLERWGGNPEKNITWMVVREAPKQ